MNYQIMKSIDVDQFKVRQSEPEANLGISSVGKEQKIFLKILLYGKCSIYIVLLKILI